MKKKQIVAFLLSMTLAASAQPMMVFAEGNAEATEYAADTNAAPIDNNTDVQTESTSSAADESSDSEDTASHEDDAAEEEGDSIVSDTDQDAEEWEGNPEEDEYWEGNPEEDEYWEGDPGEDEYWEGDPGEDEEWEEEPNPGESETPEYMKDYDFDWEEWSASQVYTEDRSGITYDLVNQEVHIKSMDGKEYSISLSGVQKDTIQKFFYVLEYLYKAPSDDPGAYDYSTWNWEDADFIDADKYNSFEWTDFDSNQCWAGTCANVLWQSGWGAKAIDPLTGNYFTSPDEILTYFTSRFVNKGYNPQKGVQWFMDGYAEDMGTGNSHLDPADNPGVFDYVDITDGLLRDYCAAKLLNTVTANNSSYEILDFLSDLQNGMDTKAYGVTITFWNEETNTFYSDSHAISLVGVMTDPDATNIIDKYKGVIIADSNDGQYWDIDWDTPDYQAINTKKTTQGRNVYSLYSLTPVTINGIGYWQMNSYPFSGSYKTVISEIWSLDNYSEESAEKSRETAGTKNIQTTYDLTTSDVETGIYYSDWDYYDLANKFSQEQDFYLILWLNNASYTQANDEDTILFNFDIQKDGEEFCTTSRTLSVADSQGLASFNIRDLMSLNGQKLKAGTYTVSINFSSMGSNGETTTEAYTLNNSANVTFFVTEDGEIVIPDNGNAGNSSGKTQNLSDQKVVPSEKIYLILEKDGKWNLTEKAEEAADEAEKDLYFTAEVLLSMDQFVSVKEVIETKDEEGNITEEKKELPEDAYKIVDSEDHNSFYINFSVDYLSQLEEGGHQYEIELNGTPSVLDFRIELAK